MQPLFCKSFLLYFFKILDWRGRNQRKGREKVRVQERRDGKEKEREKSGKGVKFKEVRFPGEGS